MERWHPDRRTWEPRPPLPCLGLGRGAARLDSRCVLIVGGMLERSGDKDAPWMPADGVSLWDGRRDPWVAQPALTTERYLHATVLLPSGDLLVIGGLGQGKGPNDLIALPSVERRGGDGSWSVCAPLAQPLSEPVASVLTDGRVLVCGGCDDDEVSSFAALYDPLGDRWHAMPPMAHPRAGHRAVRLGDGRVLVVGGSEAFSGATVGPAELWDPQGGRWTTIDGPRWPRFGHTATLLDDGRVLVAGGQAGDDEQGRAEIWTPS